MAVDDSVATQWSVAAWEIISHPGGADWVGEAFGVGCRELAPWSLGGMARGYPRCYCSL